MVGLLPLLASAAGRAQNSTSSPYSMYGVGVLTPKEDASATALGHAGVGLAPREWINLANPAGICNLDSLTFYFNIQFKYFYARESTELENQTVHSANIDGITMGFRGRKWLAMAIGYAPYSTVGYNMNERKNIYGTDQWYRVNYRGSGGLSQAFINAAFTIAGHLTLGGNFSVLWGTINKREKAFFSETNGGEDITNERKYQVNNIYWEVGAQLAHAWGKGNQLRVGAVFNNKVWLHTSFKHSVYNQIDSNLGYDDSTPERFYVPRQWGFGLSYAHRHLLGTLDYKTALWGDIANTKFKENINFRDTYLWSWGFEFFPGRDEDPFYKRLRYRAGGFYGRDYLDLRGVNLLQAGFSLGLTVPLGRSMNAITVSYEHQRRGTTNNGMVKERFNNFKIALNIRERWFLKSKFD